MRRGNIVHSSRFRGGRRDIYNIPPTIPKIKHQIPQKLDLAVLDVDSGTKTADIFCDVVAKDDAAHGGFAGARLAHKKDLLPLGLNLLHDGCCKLGASLLEEWREVVQVRSTRSGRFGFGFGVGSDAESVKHLCTRDKKSKADRRVRSGRGRLENFSK